MKIQLVLMASGFGRRFGGDKLSAVAAGRPLYSYGLTSLCQGAQAFLPLSGIDCSVTVVTAHNDIAEACRRKHIDVVWNHQALEGMAASIRIVVGTYPDRDVWGFFPADQPLLTGQTISLFCVNLSLPVRLSAVCTMGSDGAARLCSAPLAEMNSWLFPAM